MARAAEIGEGDIGAGEDLLRDLFGIVGVAYLAEAATPDPVEVSVVEIFERSDLARLELVDQGAITGDVDVVSSECHFRRDPPFGQARAVSEFLTRTCDSCRFRP